MTRVIRRLSGLFVATAALATGLAGAACGVEAVGVDGCRKIEEERCTQAVPCANFKTVKTPTEVTACKRFYRDQCLHGLSIETEPGAPVVDKCVTAVKAAGVCAKGAPDSPCPGISVLKANATACELIEHPELLAECTWLVPAPPATATTPPADGGTDAPAD